MKCLRLLLALTIAFTLTAQAANTKKAEVKKVDKGNAGPLVAAMKDYENKGDDIALRIIVKKITKVGPGYGDWIRVRQIPLCAHLFDARALSGR